MCLQCGGPDGRPANLPEAECVVGASEDAVCGEGFPQPLRGRCFLFSVSDRTLEDSEWATQTLQSTIYNVVLKINILKTPLALRKSQWGLGVPVVASAALMTA